MAKYISASLFVFYNAVLSNNVDKLTLYVNYKSTYTDAKIFLRYRLLSKLPLLAPTVVNQL